MKYRVRQGTILNHNSRIYRGGEIVEGIEPHVALDPAVVGCLEVIVEDPVAPTSEKEKK